MSQRDLQRFFLAHRDEESGLVLATVFETLGSTYSKTGDHMLISASGDFQGMLSGGCLEGDLAERAKQVAAERTARAVTYDLRRGEDDLWGLGVGCEGLMRIFLQPLFAHEDFEPFASMMAVYDGEQAGVLALVLDAPAGTAARGASFVAVPGEVLYSSLPGELEAAARPALDAVLSTQLSSRAELSVGEDDVTLLCAQLAPPPRVLVLGGGLDAVPLVRALDALGWHITVQDHRPAYLEKGDFSAARSVLCARPEELASALDLERFDAAIVMSHHLDSDRSYLGQLAGTGLSYIGLLGPAARRDRLLRELGDAGNALAARLRGPAGLDLGGRGPAAIALSIAAQMHQTLLGGEGNLSAAPTPHQEEKSG